MSNCADLIRDFEKTQTDIQSNSTSQPKVTRRSTRAGNHRTAVAAVAANPGITPGGPSALPDGHVDAVCSSLEIPSDQLVNYANARSQCTSSTLPSWPPLISLLLGGL
eukprot:SAG11_NODE_555_length_8566_cov_15.547774_3_plen_108_part_00